MHEEHTYEIAGGTLRAAPLGDRAIVLTAGNSGDNETSQLLAQVGRRLRQVCPLWVEDIVPAYETVTIYYDPFSLVKEAAAGNMGQASHEEASRPFAAAVRIIGRLLELPEGQKDEAAGRLIHIPVCYGGSGGPDLEEAAARSGLSAEAYAAMHAEAEYTVAMLGFMPGFPYLTGLPERLAQPRRAEPRKSVPAGSVAVAAQQTGIYPVSVPGGWQIIGRTSVRLFDKDAAEPALLRLATG